MGNFPNRQSIRLRGYDYSQNGLYFVTICTQNREYLFGEITRAIRESPLQVMKLNEFGEIMDSILKSLPNRYQILLDEFKIMPNHVHMIINVVGAHHDAPDNIKRSLLAQIVGYLKMNSSKLIHQIDPNIPVWQRNFYERIIRDENEYQKIVYYIQTNPQNWDKDKNNLMIRQTGLTKSSQNETISSNE